MLFGGYNKNLDFEFLKNYNFKKLICFGELTNQIENINCTKFIHLKDALSFGEYTIEYLVASAGVGYTGSLESNSFSGPVPSDLGKLINMERLSVFFSFMFYFSPFFVCLFI